MQNEQDTIFGKIVAGKIPCKTVYEDDLCLAFHDVAPQAPVHIILIPKIRGNLSRLSNGEQTDKDILGHLMWAAGEVARKEKLAENGFRIVINDGPWGCQSVYHLHLHILGGTQLGWPPGTPGNGKEAKGEQNRLYM